jgi:hypothetical protein
MTTIQGFAMEKQQTAALSSGYGGFVFEKGKSNG